ncbi:hypothetical protein CROQUDRAFT_98279 [Cronartium quercuum f. sp. fusiforme G11]|uniref:Uncharacterized protein n=1 Tax=Cronartium quercuum f. sp. fusiforme G11 TaxID=708437 RepID=A0A9P6N9L6_9BASI|nr:hypothetical protein CROQUDRAFT_98279 [Cronartium quercuum f. sp. fusiforme G11]
MELGQLLCLKEQLESPWASVSTTPEQAITCLQSANLLEQEISKQVARIGSTSLTDFENGEFHSHHFY